MIISDLQDRLVALIQADPWFSGVPILAEHVGDIESDLDVAVSKTVGCAVVVIVDSGSVATDDRRLPRLTERFEILIVQKPTLNREKNAVEALGRIVALVHWQPVVAGQHAKPHHFRVTRHEADRSDLSFNVQRLFVETEINLT